MRKRPVFVTRKVRNDGTVKIYGKAFRCVSPCNFLIGERMLFGLYYHHCGTLTDFVSLLSYEGDPAGWVDNRLLGEGGRYPYMRWLAVGSSLEAPA